MKFCQRHLQGLPYPCGFVNENLLSAHFVRGSNNNIIYLEELFEEEEDDHNLYRESL